MRAATVAACVALVGCASISPDDVTRRLTPALYLSPDAPARVAQCYVDTLARFEPAILHHAHNTPVGVDVISTSPAVGLIAGGTAGVSQFNEYENGTLWRLFGDWRDRSAIMSSVNACLSGLRTRGDRQAADAHVSTAAAPPPARS